MFDGYLLVHLLEDLFSSVEFDEEAKDISDFVVLKGKFEKLFLLQPHLNLPRIATIYLDFGLIISYFYLPS